MFLTKTKMAFSGLSLILFLTTKINWPTVRSAGTRYLQKQKLLTFTYSDVNLNLNQNMGTYRPSTLLYSI